MRPNQQNNNNNKNRSRNRNGGRKHVNPLSRNFESNGPDVKVRGNAAHIAEKYMQLARDAQSSGDSVMAENYLQHAEHYFRIVSAAQPQNNTSGREGEGDDYDDDMPEVNSRFSSPQPVNQQQNDADEGGDSQPQPQVPDRPSPRERAQVQAQLREQQREQQAAEQAAAAAAAVAAPAEATSEDDAAAQPVAAEGEARKPRERRPRRRRPAGGDAAAGDLANEPQPDIGELPAFITAGGTPTAAE